MYANLPSRAIRTSFRYEPCGATLVSNLMTWATLLVARLMRTSLGPPGTMKPSAGAAGSITHRLPLPSATTLCTHTQWSPGVTSSLRALRQAFHSSFGYGASVPSERSSATEMGESSVQRGKLTKMRPRSETVTPVT
jgi:hypothetical protein